MISLREYLSGIFEVLIFSIMFVSSKIKFSFSVLFLIIVYHFSWMNSFIIEILIVNEMWSKGCWILGKI